MGYVLPAFVGVWLGFSAKHLKQILTNFVLYVHVRKPKETVVIDRGPLPSTPLLGDYQAEKAKKKARAFGRILKDGGGVRDMVHTLYFNRELSLGYWILLLFFILLLAFATIGLIVLGIFVIKIRVDGEARLYSEKCGLWEFNRRRGGDEAATRAGIRDLEKETRAGEYAKNCYGTPSMFDAIQCRFLYRSRLPFSPDSPQYTPDCPFQNDICSQNQTVTFTTDIIDSSMLGINSQHPSTFYRRTSCTPLSMEYPYIQNHTQNGTTTYYYYYGWKPLHEPPLNYTYTTTGDPFDGFAPAYNVFAYKSGSTPTAESHWMPREELAHPAFSTITLLFISSLRILYKKRSDDPIFPADKEVFLPGERNPWFRNSDPRARPLACIDYIHVCLGDGVTCGPLNDENFPRNAKNETISAPADFWMMFASLRRTNIYNAIEKRLGRGLIAQSKVSQFYSEALGDYHWVDEVDRLFATSLARTQINAWSIASGEDSVHEGRDGYTLITPVKRYGNFCGIFKYNPPGYASIRFGWFIVIWLTFPVFLLLSRRWPWNSKSKLAAAEGESRLTDATDVRRVTPRSDPNATVISGSRSEDITAEAANLNEPTTLPPEAVSQETANEQAATGATASAITGLRTEETASALGAGQVRPPPERAVSQSTEIREIPEDSIADADVEWEPLVIGKIFEYLWTFLKYLLWQGPGMAWEGIRNRIHSQAS